MGYNGVPLNTSVILYYLCIFPGKFKYVFVKLFPGVPSRFKVLDMLGNWVLKSKSQFRE